jgi:hypothetical protein
MRRGARSQRGDKCGGKYGAFLVQREIGKDMRLIDIGDSTGLENPETV